MSNKRPEIVVITGASAGVGRATAKLFGKRGAWIGLIARDRHRLEAARDEIEAEGGRALALVADVADPEAIEAAADEVERTFGPIDIWINNAMATVFAPFEQVTAEEFRRATEVTYLGYVHGTMAALKRMKPRDRGVIVQVGSALAYRSIPLQSAYCGAKHAIAGFTDSLRSELIHDGSNVHITAVNLPAMNTPQFEWSRSRMPRHPQPVPPIFQPEVAAKAIVWAAHQRRREVNVGFPTVLATAVQKVMPGIADRYLARFGFDSQQTSDPVSPNRPDNLFRPVHGDFGAHGIFGAEAHSRSLQFWLNKNRSYFAIAGIAATGFGAWRYFKSNAERARPKSGKPAPQIPPRAENRSQIYYAWRGPSMIVLDNEGSAGTREDSGLFFRQTRFLRDLSLELFGERPHFCSVAEISPNEMEFTYVYPEKPGGGSDRGGERHGIRYRDLDIRVLFRVRPNGVVITLHITNRWIERLPIDIGWRLSADFADYSEIFGDRRQNANVICEPEASGVRFRYEHPELPLETSVRVEGPGAWSFSNGKLSARLDLRKQVETIFSFKVQTIDRSDSLEDEQAARREERLARWYENLTSVESSGYADLAKITNTCMRDIGSLALLEGPEPEWLTPAAGIPVFHSLWARDALTTAWQATMFDRGEMGDSILSTMSRLQGIRHDAWRDEQPGRIIRGHQRSPLAKLNINPMELYYGDYASPFAFIFTLAQLYAWSGEKSRLDKHFDVARRILDWARDFGDIDGDGYLEYQTLSPEGPKHQGWRDAHNAIVYPDGTQVDTPIATCELQGYWFAAQQLMAVASAVLGRFGDASAYWRGAAELKARFNRDFWMPDENCVALGLDRSKKQIRVVASNAAQTLTTGIVESAKLHALVTRLFQPDMFSGWGIRTISTHNPAYNPLSYHLGSVWPVENGTFLFGLKRFGFEREVEILAHALYDLGLLWRGHRIPECVGGYSRSEARYPGAYPQANAPQTWNQSVFPILVQTLLGILPVGALNLLSVYPVMPDWLPEITIRNLRVGDAAISLRFWRDKNGASKWQILEKRGTLHLITQPSIDSLTAGIWDRLGAVVQRPKAA
jgi:glycogen debranching enzyme/short-subunit dehydrogenase